MIDYITFKARTKNDSGRFHVVNGRRAVHECSVGEVLFVQGVAGVCRVDVLGRGWVSVSCVPGMFCEGHNLFGLNSPMANVRMVMKALEFFGFRNFLYTKWQVQRLDITGWAPAGACKFSKAFDSGKRYKTGWVAKSGRSRVCVYDKDVQTGVVGASPEGMTRVEFEWLGEIQAGYQTKVGWVEELRQMVAESVGGEMQALVSSVQFLGRASFSERGVELVKAANLEAVAKTGRLCGQVWVVAAKDVKAVERANADAKKQGKFWQLQSMLAAGVELPLKVPKKIPA